MKQFFNEEGQPTLSVDFNFAELDSEQVKVGETIDGNREILRAALALVVSPAPARQAAARASVLFAKLNPTVRRRRILFLFPGVRKSEFDSALMELSSLLKREGGAS